MSIGKNEFHAALNRLESMVKGGATQLHHTASDSDPGSHAGTGTSDYQDEHKDGIDENGTDYAGVKKALGAKVEKSQALTPAEVAIVKGTDPRPFIMAKINKGLALTSAESWVLKGGFDKMTKGSDKPGAAGVPGEADDASSVPDSHGGENEDSEIEADAKKSFGSAVDGSQTLRKGLEMSPVLVAFAQALGEGLKGTEARTVQAVYKALTPVVERVAQLENTLAKSVASQGEYNLGFAETMVGIGQHIAGNADVQAASANAPAYAPKSQLRAVPTAGGIAPVQKSFGPGGLETGSEAIAKSQIVDTMFELVKGGSLNPLDVIKYESSGEINPNVQQMVLAKIQSAGN